MPPTRTMMEWAARPLEKKCERMVEWLGHKPKLSRLDARAVQHRHLWIWLLHAGGATPVGEVARVMCCSHAAVSVTLGKLRSWDSPGVHGAAVARSLQLGTDCTDEVLDRGYAQLRGRAWPWKRSGKKGNRGRAEVAA